MDLARHLYHRRQQRRCTLILYGIGSLRPLGLHLLLQSAHVVHPRVLDLARDLDGAALQVRNHQGEETQECREAPEIVEWGLILLFVRILKRSIVSSFLQFLWCKSELSKGKIVEKE